jgi:gluconolactonase
MLLRLLPILLLVSCSSMRSPIANGAKARDHGAIGATEGPAWQNGSLYFTDGKHINQMGPDGKTTVFRHNASNGLLFDREGRLVACESGLRRVTRTEKDGSITVLAERFRGKRFNTPNDLCMDSKGRIYFTDPRYGSREGMEIYPPPSIKTGFVPKPIEGVYRIDSPGKVTRILCDGSERPNGILISPDDRFLYIADNNNNTHAGSRKLLRYTLDKKRRCEGRNAQGAVRLERRTGAGWHEDGRAGAHLRRGGHEQGHGVRDDAVQGRLLHPFAVRSPDRLHPDVTG